MRKFKSLKNFKQVLIFLGVFSLILLAPRKKALGANTYLLPKFTINYYPKGKDQSYGFGGGLGYIAKPNFCLEISYLRFFGNGGAPASNVLEADAVLIKSIQKISLFLQTGSGFYNIVSGTADGKFSGHIDAGLGLVLNFVPTLNLRTSAIYYALFSSKDLFSFQIALSLFL